MNIIEFMTDHRLLGALSPFNDPSTLTAWLAFTRAVFGLPLSEHELTLFQRHTGRTTPRVGGYAEACCITGVQSGKSKIAAAFATHAALTGALGTHALCVGQDHRGAMRVLLRYAREPFETNGLFKSEVERSTADTLELTRGTTLSAYPCRPGAIRGLRANIVCIDELAFFTATDGRPTDREMLVAARGRLATTGGKLIILSSPYAASGALYDLHRRHYGRDDSPVLCWQAAAPQMNPTLPADYLNRMAQDDPDAYRSEVLGEFRAGISTFLDPDTVAASVEHRTHERAPTPGVAYVSFDDPASGSGADAWTKAIAHREGERVVLDVLRTWSPPFNPSGVIAESAALSSAYGLHLTTGDRFAAGFVLEGFRAHGVTYAPSSLDRSALYLELLPLMNAGRVRLLDAPELLRELCGLERRRGVAGRDRIDHRPGQHDDRANAVAGALVLAAGRDPAFAAEVTAWAMSVNLADDNTRDQPNPFMSASAGCPKP